MSNDIREYTSLRHFPESRKMNITATVQGEWGSGVQFTIGDEFCVLAENQIKDLIKVLKRRLACSKGYSGTDSYEGKDYYQEPIIKVVKE